MNLEFWTAIVFYSIILLVILRYRKKFDIQAKIIALYRTKYGINLMGKIAKKFPRFLDKLSTVGIYVGFLGMFAISYLLVQNSYKLLFVKDAVSAISPVIPGIRIPGSPIFVPFWYGIISIFVVATVHEFSHGVVARLKGLDVKHSGIVFFGPIIGAFVEPDEKKLRKADRKTQLAVYAAGPFSNVLLAAVCLVIILYALNPVAGAVVEPSGIMINEVQDGYPALEAGIVSGEIVTNVAGQEVKTIDDFVGSLADKKSNEDVLIQTSKNNYTIALAENPDNATKGYLGVIISQNSKIKESVLASYGGASYIIFYLIELFKWLFMLSLGIGMANLLPLGIVDGGRMLQVALEKYIADQKRSYQIWKNVSLTFLLLLLFNLIFGLIK